MPEYIFEGLAVEVVQPIGSFVVTALPWHVLQNLTYPDPLRLATDPRFKGREQEWKDVGRLEGTQRPIERDRLKAIGRFIATYDATFPNAIILAIPGSSMVPEGPGAGVDWEVRRSKGQVQLAIPVGARLAVVVDGQHRLYAFPGAELDNATPFDVVCSVFFDLPRPMQAMIFATINTNQKPVRRGLAMNLYGYNIDDESQEFWSPEKVAVFLTRRLNFDEASPLQRLIRVEAAGAPVALLLPGAKRAITMVAVVDGILGLISTDARRDRDRLKRPDKFLARRVGRNQLTDDGSPLRCWYLEQQDGALYELLRSCLGEIKSRLWSGLSDRTGMLNRSVGVRALFRVLSHVVNEQRRKTGGDAGLADAVRRRWTEVVEIIETLDFRDDYFEATDRGRRRIELVIGHATGLITLEQIGEADRHEIVRRTVARSRG